MTKSRLGWRLEKPGSRGLTTIRFTSQTRSVHVFTVKRGTRGYVANSMLWLMTELDKIESINEVGWDGTYAYRPVRGSTAPSEHGCGTALDWNASQHMLGAARPAGWTEKQWAAVNALMNTPRGRVFRWGGQYYGRKDAMHFELRDPATFAAKAHLFTPKALRKIGVRM